MAMDVSFEMNDFAQNKLYTDAHAMAQQLYLLLLMKPGDSPDDLAKGIDFVQYNQDFAEEAASQLQSEIIKQAADYCDFTVSDVLVTLLNGQLNIVIESPSFNELLVFETDGDNVLLSVQNS